MGKIKALLMEQEDQLKADFPTPLHSSPICAKLPYAGKEN